MKILYPNNIQAEGTPQECSQLLASMLGTNKQKLCRHCATPILASSGKYKYCSKECQKIATQKKKVIWYNKNQKIEKRVRKDWKDEEIQFIQNNHMQVPASTIAKQLERTTAAVVAKMYRLGIVENRFKL